MISESERLFWDEAGAMKQVPGVFQLLRQVSQLKM